MSNEPKITNKLRDAVEAEITSKGRAIKHLAADELEDVMKCAQRESARDWALLCVTYNHALRNQEVASLKLADIDQANNMLTVQRLKSSQLTRQPIVGAAQTKGTPWLNEEAALKAWLRERKATGTQSAYIFTSQRDGSIIGQRQINRIFAGYCEMASAERVARGDKAIDSACWHIHALKHSRGSLLAEAGVDILSIKMILGHKSVRSCEVYVNPSERTAWQRAFSAEADRAAQNSWGI
jgi:site-specific recombinase XerD